jgi:hypothetical protein
MALPIEPPYPPIEALSVENIPSGNPGAMNLKAMAFVASRSKTANNRASIEEGRALSRYFPELVAAMQKLAADRRKKRPRRRE